ncbi:MAG: hypothetical protein AAGA42_11275 [Actinomycetota bacterium]
MPLWRDFIKNAASIGTPADGDPIGIVNVAANGTRQWTWSGLLAALLSRANTWTGNNVFQGATEFGGDLQFTESGSWQRMAFMRGGVERAAIAQTTGNILRFDVYDTDGSTILGTLQLLADGTGVLPILGSDLRMSKNNPRITVTDANSTADQKTIDVLVNAQLGVIRSRNDADDASAYTFLGFDLATGATDLSGSTVATLPANATSPGTGIRDVSGDLMPGWATESTYANLQRNGNVCELRLRVEYAAEEPGASDVEIYTLPEGFRPGGATSSQMRSVFTSLGGAPGSVHPGSTSGAFNQVVRTFSSVADNTELLAHIVWITGDSWPTTLPGSAVSF